MNFKSIEDLIRFAIEKEKAAIEFYESASTEEPYSAGKQTFLEFAKEEKKHKALLEGFLKGDKKLEEYRFKWVPDMKRSDYMVDLKHEKGMAYPELLRLAMKREEKALQLYNDLASNAEQPDWVKVFKMLCQEEAAHKLKLETIYDDYMAKMGD